MIKEKKTKPAVVISPDQDVVVLGRSQPSVLLKVDKNGERSYEIKVYADSAEEAGKIARIEAKKIDSLWLKK